MSDNVYCLSLKSAANIHFTPIKDKLIILDFLKSVCALKVRIEKFGYHYIYNTKWPLPSDSD